jgi:hypothetical protein
MGEGVPAHVQQLEDLVERRGVARAVRANREDAVDLAWDQCRLQQRFTGAHPVAVALNRVDLTVVGDVAVGVGERP